MCPANYISMRFYCNCSAVSQSSNGVVKLYDQLECYYKNVTDGIIGCCSFLFVIGCCSFFFVQVQNMHVKHMKKFGGAHVCVVLLARQNEPLQLCPHKRCKLSSGRSLDREGRGGGE